MADIPQKIPQADPASQVEPGSAKKKPQRSGDGAFDKIFTHQISGQIPGENASSSQRSQTGLPEIQGSFRASKIAQIHDQISSEQNRFLEQMTSSLDLFDQYAAFLGDPDKNLKQTYSLLEQILQLTGSLSKEMSEYQGKDESALSELRNLADQLLTTARVEQIKFDRGDYL